MFLCLFSSCYSKIESGINGKNIGHSSSQGGLKAGFYEINSGINSKSVSDKKSLQELKNDYIPPGLEEVLAGKFEKTGTWYNEEEGIWTQNVGATVSYKFKGTKAYVVGIIDNKHGNLEAYVDDVKVGTFSAYGPDRLYRKLLYATPDLSNGEHTLKLRLASVACALHAFYILNNDGAGMFEISKTSFDVVRGESFDLALTRVGSDSTESSVVFKTVAGSAIPGIDYIEYSATLYFKAEEKVKYIKIETINNTQEYNLSFSAQISSPSSGALIGFTNTSRIVIHNGEPSTKGLVLIPLSQLSYDGDWKLNPTVAETEEIGAAAVAKFTGTRIYIFGNKGDELGKMDIFIDHAKAASVDCNGKEEHDVLLFASETLSVESDHTIRASLVEDKIAITKVVYLNNEGTGLVEFKSKEASIKRGQVLEVEVSRIGGSLGKMSVSVDTFDGTAVAGDDYEPYSGTLIFDDGETSKTFSIKTHEKQNAEDGTFTIKLTNPTDDAVIGYINPVTVTIYTKSPHTRTPELPTPSPSKGPDDQKSGHTVLIVSVVSAIVIVLVIIVVAAVLIRRKKHDDPVISQPMLNSNPKYTGA